MIKGILFDIDDTLYSHKINAVPKASLYALDKLHDNGYKIGVCTSRVAAETANLPEELWRRIDCKIIGTGATTIVDGQYFKSYIIDQSDARKYVDFFEAHEISYHYTDINGDLYYWGDLDKVNAGERLSFASGNVKFKPYEEEEITNLFYYNASDEDLPVIAQINPGALISSWGNSGNICAPLIDKSFGLLKFCQVYSFTCDEVVAAGDGGNDDVMLQMAGIGIAVNNAKQNTKAMADYICQKSIEDGGLYDAFVDLGLIEEDSYEIEMFVFDNDSTLFDHSRGYIHEESIDALKKLKEKGYLLVLNTSRSYEETYNIPKEVLDLMDALILLNGAYVVKKDKVEITCIPKEDVKRVFAFLDQNNITYRYCTKDGKGYLNRHDPEHEALFLKLYGVIPKIKEYEGEDVLQLLYYATGDLREEVIAMCQNEECDRITICGEISPLHKNKGEAMLEVAKSFGVDKQKICAFGDNGNDIEMIRLAGLGICMGNGIATCKEKADYICDAVENEGIVQGLKHFGFLEG